MDITYITTIISLIIGLISLIVLLLNKAKMAAAPVPVRTQRDKDHSPNRYE